MNKEFIIFLSGPITGLSYEDSTQWRQDVQNKLPANIIPLSPLRNKEHLKREKDILDHYDHILSTSKSITKMDYFDVKRSDIILVNLLNTKRVSIGTVMEVAWAYEMGKPIVIAMEDDNIHQHSMIRECADFILSDIDQALDIVLHMLMPGDH
jgi:nucleoside 2-deoxyribosyltransferase